MNNTNLKTRKLTFLGVMLSLTIVFVALTVIPTTSASMALLIFLPTIITSIIYGPKTGALMGALSGTVTLLRALFYPASPLDYLFKKIIKSKTVSLLIAGASGALTNTGLVILMLYIIYSDRVVAISTEFGIGTTFAAFAVFLVTTSALIESTVAGIGTSAVVSVYDKVR